MKPLSVTEVNRIIKYTLREVPNFDDVTVIGEITNFNERSRYGHWYFALKDAGGQLSCNMFMNQQSRVKFRPENGMKVLCRGRIDVYEKNGVYQLYAVDMTTVGDGDDMLALMQLRKKLDALGIFNPALKKPLPKYPRKIGIVTSASGAAVEDLKSNIERRWGLSEIVIAPALVQGDKAPGAIVRAISRLDAMPGVDVIIVGRGGGAGDDLNAFNTEAVAMAVYACQTPVISAVGHKIDHTLCDDAADYSVPTPSTAAETVVPDKNEEIRMLREMADTLYSEVAMRLEREENRLIRLSLPAIRNAFYEKQERGITEAEQRIRHRAEAILREKQGRLEQYAAKLHALSPLSVLGRGYAIARRGGAVVHSVNDVKPADKIEVILTDGSFAATVDEVNKNE